MTDEIRAADIAKSLGVSAREARVKLRAAGIRAPYAAKDVQRMKEVIKGPAPAKGAKAATAKPAKVKAPAKPKAAPKAKAAPTLPAVKLDTATEPASTIN